MNVPLALFVIMLLKQCKYSTFPVVSIIICNGDDSLEILITSVISKFTPIPFKVTAASALLYWCETRDFTGSSREAELRDQKLNS
jgi:hypothetical protein